MEVKNLIQDTTESAIGKQRTTKKPGLMVFVSKL